MHNHTADFDTDCYTCWRASAKALGLEVVNGLTVAEVRKTVRDLLVFDEEMSELSTLELEKI